MAEGGDRGGDAVTSTSSKQKGGILTQVGKVLKRLWPGTSSKKEDHNKGTMTEKQSGIENKTSMECEPTEEEREQCQSRGRGIGDVVHDPGTDPSDEIHHDRDPSNKESSSLIQGADLTPTFSELLAQWNDYQLFQLTTFYLERLKQAIEEKVERLGFMMRWERCFNEQEHGSVAELAVKGNRGDSSTLFLSLVMGNGNRARRVMWESFVKMQNELPKLDKILKEIQELGLDPQEYMNITKRLSELPSHMEGKRSFLNTLHYLFDSQNPVLAQQTLGSVETLSFCGLGLTPIDCAVLSHAIKICDTIKHLDLTSCHIQCEGLQQLGPALHKCQYLRLGDNNLGDSGVKLVSAALRNPDCKIQTLWLEYIGLTDSGTEDLVSALSTNPSLTELNLSENKLGNSGVKLLSAALRNPDCKIQTLWLDSVGLTHSGAEDLASALSTIPSLTELHLNNNKLGDSGVRLVSAALRNPDCKTQRLLLDNVGLTDSGAEDIISALSTNPSLTELRLAFNSLTDRSVPALRRLILTLPSLERIMLGENKFSEDGRNQLQSLWGIRCGLSVDV